MIDIESQVFSKIYNVLTEQFANITVEGLPNLSPSVFPYVSIEQSDSFSYYIARTDESNEDFAEVVYDINVFSKSDNKKQECKAICKVIDEEFNKLGFTRYTLEPILIGNGSIMRYFMRFRAVVSKHNMIYKR